MAKKEVGDAVAEAILDDLITAACIDRTSKCLLY